MTSHRLGQFGTVAESQLAQACQAFGHFQRAIRQLPDEQADLCSFVAQFLARHQPGDLAACPGAPVHGLYMLWLAPVQLALQDPLAVLAGQLSGDCCNPLRIGGPVLASAAVAAADRLGEATIAVDQRDRYAVDLWLHPEIAAMGQPVAHRRGVRELVQAGVNERVADFSGATGQGCRGGDQGLRKAGLPLP